MRSSRNPSSDRGSRDPSRWGRTGRRRCWRAGSGPPATDEGAEVSSMTDRRPLVAISEGFADYGDYYGYGYGRPLLAADALPVLLPYYEREEDRVELIERIDGLVLAGG